MPRLLGLLVAIELGLLSPLTCVVHCLLTQLSVERPAIAFFLCGEHVASLASSGNLGNGEIGFTSHSTPSPRALYEMAALDTAKLAFVSVLLTVLFARSAHLLASLTLPPPTPPPRLS